MYICIVDAVSPSDGEGSPAKSPATCVVSVMVGAILPSRWQINLSKSVVFVAGNCLTGVSLIGGLGDLEELY